MIAGDLFGYGAATRLRLADTDRAIAQLEEEDAQTTLIVEEHDARQARLRDLYTDRETLQALLKADGTR